MKTITEIRIEAIRLIDKIIILQFNVNNGCISDKPELEAQMVRLAKIKTWAVQNNQIEEIRHYFASHFFGHSKQFIAAKLSEYFI